MPTRTTNDPFTPRKDPRELLQRYAQGGLSAEEEHDLELAAERDPLLRDALAGLKMPQAAMGLGQLDRSRPTSIHNGWWVGAVIVAVVGLFVVSYLRTDTSGPDGSRPNVAERPAFIPTPIEPVQHARIDSELVTARPPIEVRAELKTPERFERPVDAPPLAAPEEPHPTGTPSPIEPVDVKPVDVKPTEVPIKEEPRPELRTPVDSRELLFVHDLKLVAPAELYAANPLVVMDLNAVPANFADQGARKEAEQQGPTMRYSDFMGRALGKYARGDARGCLEEALFLLDQYPDDVNALFYAGLASYDLGLYPRAERFLARAASHKVNSFSEEATWYRALALRGSGRMEEARPIFEQVAEQGGFYAERARRELGK